MLSVLSNDIQAHVFLLSPTEVGGKHSAHLLLLRPPWSNFRPQRSESWSIAVPISDLAPFSNPAEPQFEQEDANTGLNLQA